MALDGSAISCDAYACGTKDDFDGELSDEDARVRYNILGWQIVGVGLGTARGTFVQFTSDRVGHVSERRMGETLGHWAEL